MTELTWALIVLGGSYLANGELTSGAFGAALAVAVVVWIVRKDVL